MAKELKHKPLVEAILEIRWKLQGKNPGPLIDPHYKLLLGRLYDRVTADYPEHEQLPSANMPDELFGHIVQHRFRTKANSWPLIQVGPGIFTVNSTSDYRWVDFRPRVIDAISKLYNAHPKVEDLKVTNLILRYIDAVEFNFEADNAFCFLKEKLKLGLSLPDSLFDGTGVENKPSNLVCQCSFNCSNPKGVINIRFALGQKDNTPAIIWDTSVESVGEDIPEMPKDFEKWFNAAHDLEDDWFFKLIEGELKRRFSGE